jgi:FkbH-like protein
MLDLKPTVVTTLGDQEAGAYAYDSIAAFKEGNFSGRDRNGMVLTRSGPSHNLPSVQLGAAMALGHAEYLFPRDLEINETQIKNVLIVGSCSVGVWALKICAPDVHFDYLVMNNVGTLPDSLPVKITDYDFTFVQMSLWHILTDRVIRFGELTNSENMALLEADAMQNLEVYLEACLKYNKEYQSLTFVSNFPVPQRSASNALVNTGSDTDLSLLIQRLNNKLVELVLKYKNVYISDYDSLANAVGKRYFSNDLMGFYAHNAFWHADLRRFDVDPEYTRAPRIEPVPEITDLYPSQLKEMLEALWRQWVAMYRTVNQVDAVKLVIFDLDDTMWRGQIAEHYGEGDSWPPLDGWPTGLWEAVNHLRARGIMVGICSKNEETIVRDRWDRAVLNQWVRLDDFLFREINWKPKAENIANIIQQASLTPKSVVFVDDNPVERESVRLALPGIRVLGANPYVLRRVLLWSPEMQVARISTETANREEMMRQQIKRETDRASISRKEFLQKLNCSVQILAIESSESKSYSRAFELLNKTNQFNTTGKRWAVSEMASFLADGGKIFAFHVEDRYTKYGLVGVILYKNGVFEQFAMSCRVLGLEIETSVISAIVASEQYAVGIFSARVVETLENIVCRDVYRRSGFRLGDGGIWVTDKAPIPVAPHIALTFDADSLERSFVPTQA